MADTQEYDKVMKDAQYRKGLSIAFFNATNAAIALVSSDERFRGGDITKPVLDQTVDTVRKLRDMLLEDHKIYYATVISKVGANYKPEETIKKLNTAKDKAELKKVWISLSEDDRRDPEIKKAVKVIKEKVK